MGLAEEGYIEEEEEEGEDIDGGPPGVGPMEGEGRMLPWEGGADGGSINALDGGFEPGA